MFSKIDNEMKRRLAMTLGGVVIATFINLFLVGYVVDFSWGRL
ncbi:MULTISPECIES: hypothetical protein [unclassified Butyrivibrio]|nr:MULTISPECIES: hypothetical protein [unclassified Butyrivibrio]